LDLRGFPQEGGTNQRPSEGWGARLNPAHRLLVPWNTPPSHLELVLNITLASYIKKYFRAQEEL
jgi:hypothetical protein